MLIKKDGTVLNVTRGAYLSLFEPRGWKPYKGSAKTRNTQKSANFMSPQPNKTNAQHSVNAKDASEIPFENMLKSDEDEDYEDEDYDVVLEEMTVKELIEYADEKDIDLDGATRKDDIIATIREAMEED